jgi:hypothetical protein
VSSSQKIKRINTCNLPDYSKVVLEKPLVPFGLGSVIKNYHKNHKLMDSLYYGVEDEVDIQESFEKMKSKVNGSGTIFKNRETGEMLELKNKSRWNEDSDYSLLVKDKFKKEVEGLRHVTMLTLTLDKKLVAQLIPDWWSYDMRMFVILHFNTWVSSFLHQLRMYFERQKKKWHYIGHVVEFHDGKRNHRDRVYIQDLEDTNRGLLHCHMIFSGNYIAPLKLLHTFWGLCQYQGIECRNDKKWKAKNGKTFSSSLTGKDAAGYVVKYIGKTLNGFKDDPELSKLAKWFWFFRRRLFNTRHKGRGLPSQSYELAGLFHTLKVDGEKHRVKHVFDDEPQWMKMKRRGREIYRWGMRLAGSERSDEEWAEYLAVKEAFELENRKYQKVTEADE